MTRRNAREIIMQMLYECDFHQEEDRERIFHERIKIIQEEAIEEGQQKGSNKAIFKFMESEYYGVLEHLAEIDELIAKSATNWSMDRIAKVDHMILRLAIYELKWAEDIPRKVIANEAVEIAKMYSTDKSPKFINGVLGNIIKLIEV